MDNLCNLTPQEKRCQENVKALHALWTQFSKPDAMSSFVFYPNGFYAERNPRGMLLVYDTRGECYDVFDCTQSTKRRSKVFFGFANGCLMTSSLKDDYYVITYPDGSRVETPSYDVLNAFCSHNGYVYTVNNALWFARVDTPTTCYRIADADYLGGIDAAQDGVDGHFYVRWKDTKEVWLFSPQGERIFPERKITAVEFFQSGTMLVLFDNPLHLTLFSSVLSELWDSGSIKSNHIVNRGYGVFGETFVYQHQTFSAQTGFLIHKHNDYTMSPWLPFQVGEQRFFFVAGSVYFENGRLFIPGPLPFMPIPTGSELIRVHGILKNGPLIFNTQLSCNEHLWAISSLLEANQDEDVGEPLYEYLKTLIAVLRGEKWSHKYELILRILS